MKRIFLLFTVLVLVSCNLEENIAGFFQDNDEKSDIVVKLADSYLAGNFDIARDYFTPDGKHYFNNLEFDVDGIIDGYNSHSLIFEDIKHNDRKVYTGTFTDGTVETFHDFVWSATSIITGKEYYYPCHPNELAPHCVVLLSSALPSSAFVLLFSSLLCFSSSLLSDDFSVLFLSRFGNQRSRLNASLPFM